MTTLPRLVEFVESIVKDTGDFAAYHGGAQVRIIAFTGLTRISFTAGPASNRFALLAHTVLFGKDTVPNAFTATVQHAGHGYFSGTVTRTVIEGGLDFFLIATGASPVYYSFYNQTNVLQGLEVIAPYTQIPTEADYRLIMRRLNVLSNAEQSTLLQRMANALERGKV